MSGHRDDPDDHVNCSPVDAPALSTCIQPQAATLQIQSSIMDDRRDNEQCRVCNKLQPSSSFVMLPCSHRFCGQCASMICQTQLCPFCVSLSSSSPADLTSPCSGSLFSDTGEEVTATNLSLDSTFSIWNPLSPKSLIKHESQRSSSCTAVSSGLFPLAAAHPITATSTLNWHTVPSAEIQQTFSINYPKCTMCSEDNAVATVRCMQCDETLCSECIVAHYRMRVTREHKVVRIEAFKGLVLPQLSTGNEPIKFENLETETCSNHSSPLMCTCITCGNVPLCHMCVADHSKHQLIPYGDLRTSLLTLIMNSKHDQKNLEDALKTVQGMVERVDASVQSAIRELRSAIHLHISALEERKRELLQRVDTIREAKISALKVQGEKLGQRYTVLTEALKAAEVATAVNDGIEIQQRNSFDTLLGILREPHLYLVPNETDLVKFIPPDSTFISKLRVLGELDSGACARTTHIIGDGYRRAIRDRMCTILVQTRDACGDVCTSTAHQVTASLHNPEGRAMEIRVTEQDGGVYLLSYYPLQEGNHYLDIKIRGVSICGCPTVIYARKGRDYGTVGQSGPIFSFGSEGSADGQFCRPWGICCDNKGRIVVADRSNNRIQVFDKDGHFLYKFGSAGTRPGQFDRPAGVAVNSMNEIVVADKDNHRIQVFSERGDFLLKFGERGRTPGLFNYPWGVAVNSFNQIAVSDTRNHRVQVFSPQGHFLRKFGFDNSLYNYKNLDSPRGVCYLHDGQLIITDFNNHRLVVMTSRGAGDVKMYGSEGDSEGSFCRPQGITTDNEGHILVCDSRNNRIQVLSLEGMRCVATFGGATASHSSGTSVATNSGSSGSAGSVSTTSVSSKTSSAQSTASASTLQFPVLDRPTDLCVSPDGLIYVIDFGGSCVRVY